MSDHIYALKEIVGERYVLTEAADKEAYETPWRGEKGNAVCVVRPKNQAEISQVIGYLSTHGLSFVTQSGNTGLVGASTPDQSGEQVLLSLNRLTETIEINVANKSARVSAGVRLSTLNKIAAEYGLFFPIDLSADPCIGGMAATNTGGGRLLKYGDVRQNLLGLSVVLKDGFILKLDSALHKNNTGLDLKQIFIGTGGQSGVITECIVKLSIIPKQSVTALIVPKSDEILSKLLVACEDEFGDELSAFEGMSKNAIEAAFTHNKSNLKNGFYEAIPDYVCLIELNRSWNIKEGETSLDNALQMGLNNIIEKDASLIQDALFGHTDEHWKLRHALSEAVQNDGKMIGFDLSFERDKAIAFRSFVQKSLPENFADIKMCDFGHIGDGAIHCNFVIAEDDPRLQDAEFIENFKSWVFEKTVQDFQGSYSAEHGIGPSNQAAYEKYTPDRIKKIAYQILLD